MACGTGGMLSTAHDFIVRMNPDANVRLFGQENNPESHAICLADMLIKNQAAENIRFADTMKEDCFESTSGSKWWLCGGDCAVCKYRTAGDSLSLDYEQEVVGDIREDESADVDSIVTDRIIFEQLLKRLDVLMPEARRIGELRLDGLSDSNIADILGIPRTTFLSRLKKAKAQLHDEYNDNF